MTPNEPGSETPTDRLAPVLSMFSTPLSPITTRPQSVVIIGAGPAGLTAAYFLTRAGRCVTVLEADPEYVGGIARTVQFKGFRFDIGGHRFFSKSQEIEDLWTEILGDDLLERPRLSRIYYHKKFYSYPLKAGEALKKLGLLESTRCVLSYLKAKLLPVKNPRSFQDWVSNHFGSRLFSLFFKTYTEKVWGMTCSEISADWAAQRIKGLSLFSAIWAAIFPAKAATDRSKTIKTLIHSFRYPRKGPGMMWEETARRVRNQGGEVCLGARVTNLQFISETNTWRVGFERAGQPIEYLEAEHVISSAPMRELARAIEPKMPEQVLEASSRLRYRDFLVVALILRPSHPFDDNWIYIHEPNIKVGRVQNFGSWSPEMVPDPALACYGLAYFCFEGDGLWSSPDTDLIDLAKRELETLGLVKHGDVLDGYVVRQPKAYPVYDDEYAANVDAMRREIQSRYPGLHLVGRNGMHKYNNQDHAMMTAILTARNIIAGEAVFDVWNVNQDAEYLEEDESGGPEPDRAGRLVPKRVASEPR